MCRSLLISVLAGAISLSGAFAESDAEKGISEAESRFYEAKSKIDSDYRRDFAEALSKGETIEVYLLDFETERTPSDFLYWDTRLEEDEFPIIPYGAKSKILKRAILTDDQKRDFLPKLQKVIGVQGDVGGGAFCHMPIHGVRITAGEKIIFQSSFCWKCGNFAFTYPDRPAWIEIHGSEIAEAFNKLMPIPQSEIDRFESKYGKKSPDAAKKADQSGEKPDRAE
ncbi:hypothetical protein [Luteolibacter soli]|uniref:Lipoprotein n=1 Tax=Luteolibacter soli TaxID=3135280 RepID=A0ABU9AT45_9BACT